MPFSLLETPPTDLLQETRAKIAEIGRVMFARFLADAAGGNISVRVGNRICITPRYSGSQKQWQLNTDDVLVADLERNILHGKGKISREAHVHFSLHREFSEYGSAVIHAHARNLLVFAAAAKPLPPVLEATRKFGTTPIIDYAPAHSPKLAENIIKAVRGREERIRVQAVGTLAPYHGLFLMGKDLDAAFDAVERLDNNAYCIIMGAMLLGSEQVTQNYRQMEQIVGGYKEE
ncbi:MAG: class II aldolase/adducin family protein [Anaerolineae bacterium]|nr:class II aldolase/adducin family protein [Anaerolineae bacterium]